MPKRLTTAQFVKKAEIVHQHKYLYNKTKYVRAHDNVIITCPEHGDFYQTPDNHIHGKGCPECNPAKRNDQHSFLKKARAIHGNYYDYSKTVFTRNKDKVVIICPKHGRFLQEANSHLQGFGCPKCYNEFGRGKNFDIEARAERRRKTVLQKYGVNNVMQVEQFRKKNDNTKRLNGTFNKSSEEELGYKYLVDFFGIDDVVRQYDVDSRYPFRCDFYIKSRDMFIELNISWTHGRHWFGSDMKTDYERVSLWKTKAGNYYKNAVAVFTDRDVTKRSISKLNSLNYVVFWDQKLRDLLMWLSSGAPDAHDYDVEYSWLPDMQLISDNKNYSKVTPRIVSRISKRFQFSVFYAEELKMWNDFSLFHNGFPLRAWLFMNRFQYLNKSPLELTSQNILSSFAISGVHRGYSSFDSTLMLQVLDEYKPKFIFDLFAGWGERMLVAASMNVSYVGVDVNKSLMPGYANMIRSNNLKDVKFKIADSQDVIPDIDTDMVITCPPYYDLEIYTNSGIENLSYVDFLKAWNKVVANCDFIPYFCFQINQKYKTDLMNIVLKHGYILIDSKQFKNNKSSHLQYHNGKSTKKEFEELLIFKKL